MFVVLLMMAPLSQKLEPPANPERFTLGCGFIHIQQTRSCLLPPKWGMTKSINLSNLATSHLAGGLVMRKFSLVIVAALCFATQAIAEMLSDQLGAIADSRICPRDLSEYNTLSYKGEGCDARCDQFGYGTQVCGNCQNAVDRANKNIRRYNTFVKSCNRSR